MADQKGVRIFPLEFFLKSSDNKRKNIQINPSTAIAQSESRTNITPIATGLTMLVVAAIVVIGGMVRKSQYVNVEAGFDYKKSLQGMVLSRSTQTNDFKLGYESSQDERIAGYNHPIWTVSLPPGVTFDDQQKLQVCYQVRNIASDLQNARISSCSAILGPGTKVLIEYLILNGSEASLVAKKIIGQIQ